MRRLVLLMSTALAAACSSDVGPLEGGAPTSGLAGREFIGGFYIGNCLSHEYFQAFDADGTYTLGFANWNICLPPEKRGIGLCKGTYDVTPSGQLLIECVGDPDDQVLELEDFRLEATADPDGPRGPSFFALSEVGPNAWRGELRFERGFRRGEPQTYQQTVALTADRSLDALGPVAVQIEWRVRASYDPVDPRARLVLDERVTDWPAQVVDVDGARWLRLVQPEPDRFTDEVWREALGEVIGWNNSWVPAVALPHALYIVADRLVTYAPSLPMADIPAQWEETDRICDVVEVVERPAPAYEEFCHHR